MLQPGPAAVLQPWVRPHPPPHRHVGRVGARCAGAAWQRRQGVHASGHVCGRGGAHPVLLDHQVRLVGAVVVVLHGCPAQQHFDRFIPEC